MDISDTENSIQFTGLSQAEAILRLKIEGPNDISTKVQRKFFLIAIEVLLEPMFLLLTTAGVIYLFLGDINDALLLLAFVCMVLGITLYQEYKTERVLEALRKLTSPRAHVIRDGTDQRIAGLDVVRGDILVVAEGDRVPADAILIECSNISVDESLLTGESVPVRKISGTPDQISDISQHIPVQPGGNDLANIFSGTLVVQGRGVARVRATGVNSEIGKIGKVLYEVKTESSPLQKEINVLVRRLAFIGAATCLVFVLIYGFSRHDWLNGLLSGITLAMSVLPEEYPLVLTVFLAMGAWRISKHRILTRRIPTVEALGSTTVLCVDKTGTLTLNRMSVQALVVHTAFEYKICMVENNPSELPESFHELLEFAVLASEPSPFDPMEKAITELTRHYLRNTEHLHQDWEHKHDYALTPEQPALSHVWKARERDEFVVACKGAPETIADLCHLSTREHATLDTQINILAEKGMRVLGVARAYYSGPEWPEIQHDFEFEFVGLIGLADPVRPNVDAAIRECNTAGIRVVMITGDYPATASAIAQKINLTSGTGGIISGTELHEMDEHKLRERIRQSNIFARMVPQQKLRLVNALKFNGEVVAMTGDGVNDAPALKAAHIGIAMGGRGTDVAREAASLVLLDDDFTSIVQAIRMGRGIFDNMRKAMAYIFAVHIPIVGLSFIPLMFGWPAVLAPIHIVFLEMIINPACSIAFEAETTEKNIMERPPRDPNEPLFGKSIFLISVSQGLIVLLATLSVLGYTLYTTASIEVARTLAFATIVIGNIGLIMVNRTWNQTFFSTISKPNPALWWVIGGALCFLTLALTHPFMQKLFHFSPVNFSQVSLSVIAGIGSVIWFEWFKMVRRNQGA